MELYMFVGGGYEDEGECRGREDVPIAACPPSSEIRGVPTSTLAVEACPCCKRFGPARHSNVPSSSGHWASGLVGEEDVDIGILGFHGKVSWEMRVGSTELVNQIHGLSENVLDDNIARM